MRGSCTVAIALPVQRQEVHITLPVPEQGTHMPAAWAPSLLTSTRPREPHWAQGR